jgi:hypothetical protein
MTFSLKPFPSKQPPLNLQITGNIARKVNQLNLCYILKGDLEEVVIAPPSDRPIRQHELWQNTCFEFFLGLKNSERYWEFNLSPAGHWNVYRFDAYRQGMQEEVALRTLPFRIEQRADRLKLALELNLDRIFSASQSFEVAITAVLKHRDDEVTYWALIHRGVEADFHLRESFTIEF